MTMRANHTITRKIMVAIMGTSIAVLLVACASFVTYEMLSYRRSLARELTTRARIIAANSTAALAFQNDRDAVEVLSAFRNDPHIVAASLYDVDGRLFARYPEEANVSLFPSAPGGAGHRFNRRHCTVFLPVEYGGRRLGTVYLQSDLGAMHEALRLHVVVAFVVVACALCLAFGLSTWLRKRIANPILSLAATAREVTERRDYALRAAAASDDEIGLLTASFNDMLGEIQERDASLRRDIDARRQAELALRESEERYRLLVGVLTSVVWATDASGRFVAPQVSWSSYTRQAWGGQRGMGWLAMIRAEDRKRLEALFQGGGRGDAVHELEVGLWHAASQEHRWCVARALPLRAPEGSIREWVGTMTDVHDRRLADEEIRRLNTELEQRVRLRTAQLEAANKELEAFSYSVSHDLRTPLRGIDGFSRALLEDYAEVLGDKGREYIERTCAGAQRMAQLIDDLLNLSRLNRSEMAVESVDLSARATAILDELAGSQPDRRVDARVEEGMVVSGDSRLLHIALENLLRNAWKFTRRRSAAMIEVGRSQKDGQTIFFVRDNGAGFDMAYSAKLFGAFQRLHGVADFEGTGVGLATVQRIIDRHGGRIWAEAEVEKGATFYFTLANIGGRHATEADLAGGRQSR